MTVLRTCSVYVCTSTYMTSHTVCTDNGHYTVINANHIILCTSFMFVPLFRCLTSRTYIIQVVSEDVILLLQLLEGVR